MNKLWQDNKVLVLGFLAALILTTVLLVRLVADVVYWPKHRDTEIASWMTVGYVAHSYDVDIDALTDALGLETDLRRHLTLKAIAKAQNTSFPDVQKALLKAVAIERANH